MRWQNGKSTRVLMALMLLLVPAVWVLAVVGIESGVGNLVTLAESHPAPELAGAKVDPLQTHAAPAKPRAQVNPSWLTAALRRFRHPIEPVDIDSGHSCELYGSVVAEGKPWVKMAGLRVRLTAMWLDGVVSTQLDFHEEIFLPTEAVTDAQGRFRLAEVPLRRTLFVVLYRNDVIHEVHKVRELPLAGRRLNLGELTLRERGDLRGRVVDHQGRGLANLLVRAIDDPLNHGPAEDEGLRRRRVVDVGYFNPGRLRRDTPWRSMQRRRDRVLPFPMTRTDSNGRFVLRGVRTGAPSLCLSGANVLDVRSELPVVAARMTDLGVLVVPQVWPRYIYIVDARGRPRKRVQVSVRPQGWPCPVATLRSDDRGMVQVVAPPGRLEVFVRKTSSARWRLALDDRGVGGYSVPPLLKSHRIRVVSGNRTELPAVDLLLLQEDTRTGHQMLLRQRSSAMVVDGAIEFRLANLPADARIEFLVIAQGHAPCAGILTSKNPAPHIQIIRLQPAINAVVRVVDSDGAPMRGARVSAVFKGRDGQARHLLTRRQPVVLGVTDAAGQLAVSSLWSDRIELAATAAGYVQTPMPAFDLLEGDTATIVLRRSSRLEGQLQLDGVAPQRSLEIWARPRDGVDGSADPGWFLGRTKTLTGPEGTFHFNDLYPGAWTLTIRAPSSQPGAEPDQRVWPEGESELVHVQAGERSYHTMKLTRPVGTSRPVQVRVEVQGRPMEMSLHLVAVGPMAERSSANAGMERKRAWLRHRRRNGLQAPSNHSSDQARVVAMAKVGPDGLVSLQLAEPGNHEIRLLGMRTGRRQVLATKRVVVSEDPDAAIPPLRFDLHLGDVRLHLASDPPDDLPWRYVELLQQVPEGQRGARFRVVSDARAQINLRGIPAGRYRVLNAEASFTVVAGTFFERFLILR